MSQNDRNLTRRDAVAACLLAAGGVAVLGLTPRATAAGSGAASPEEAIWAAHANDWDWLVGRWTVRHRRLKARLAGNNKWDEFGGTCINWPLLGGKGNVDDNVLELPSGTYRGVGIRAFDVETRKWSIWWLDARNPVIDPPVHGGFEDGVGTFIGDDTFDGRPIKVRFRWSMITPTSAHWDQAFSPDDGVNWEPNWYMDFARVPS